nr:hypothetical protein [Rhizobacter sp. SG703]
MRDCFETLAIGERTKMCLLKLVAFIVLFQLVAQEAHASGTVTPLQASHAGCYMTNWTTSTFSGDCRSSVGATMAALKAYWTSPGQCLSIEMIAEPDPAVQPDHSTGFSAWCQHSNEREVLSGLIFRGGPAQCPENASSTPDQCVCNVKYRPYLHGSLCKPDIDLNPPHNPPHCDPSKGNPIYPLRGVKREFIDTGLRVGNLNLRLTYDTTNKSPMQDGAQLEIEPGSLGALWFSSLHRKLEAQAGGQSVLADRGDGRIVSFAADGNGGFTTPADGQDKLFSANGGYRYVNMVDGSQEIYGASGLLTSITLATGRSVSLTYSTETWSTVASEGQSFSVTGTQTIRYGADTRWIVLPVSGAATCSGAYFGPDPAPNIGKSCQQLAVQPSTVPKGGLLLTAQDNDGRQIGFGYNSAGRLVQVTDAAGQAIAIGYDAQDNLSSVAWPDGRSRTYVYENSALPWALTGMVDERSVRKSTFGYDDAGRAIGTEYAGGVNKYTASYSTPPSIAITEVDDTTRQVVVRTHAWVAPQGTVVTEPSGSSASLSATTVNGKSYLSGQSQAAGAGCAATSRAQTYDANGNVASRDDFNGTRSCSAYDLTRNLETSRAKGLGLSQACSAVITANASLPAGARKTSTQWHPDWQLETKVAAPGRITTSVYNGQPDPFNGNAVASCAPATALLPDGKPIAVLCKKVEQSTTDVDGHLGFSAPLQSGVASRVSMWTYNAYGQVLTAKGPRTSVNDTTTYAYYTDTTADHTVGDLMTVTNAAGKVTTYNKYNKLGQLLQSTDPNGNVTINTYDARQHLLTSSVAGETTTYAYDPVGQLVQVTQADGSWVGYEYDDAHRQKAVKDNLGNRIEYQLDNAGNTTGESVKDPTGSLKRSLGRVMDALGRIQQNTGRE